MNGDSGQNQVSGSNSSDNLIGSSGADFLDGGAGDDTLNGGLGADTYDGGSGSDRYILSDTDAVDTLNFSSDDVLDVSALLPDSGVTEANLKQFVKVTPTGVYLDSAGAGQFSTENQVAKFAANNPPLNAMIAVQIADTSVIHFDWTATSNLPLMDAVSSTSQDDSGSLNQINGTQQADSLQGTANEDALYGKWGDDVIDGGAGADLYVGGQGSDRYVLANGESVDTLDFQSTRHQQDVLDVSQLLPGGVTAENISNYVKVTEDGVYVDEEGAGEFSDADQVAEFTESSIFSRDQLQVQITPNTTVVLNVVTSVGVQFESGESFEADQTLTQKLHKYQLSAEAQGAAETHDANASTGFIRSGKGQKFNLKLDDYNLTEAHGGEGDEQIDATSLAATGAAQSTTEADHAIKLFGRDGNDTLKGNDDGGMLDGGEGSDRIEAGKGRNLLIGGEGEDEFALTLESSADEIKSDKLYDFSSQEGNRDLLDLQGVLPAEVTAENIHSYVKVTENGVFVDVAGKAHFNEESQLARFGERVDIDNLINLRLADGSNIQINRDEALSTIQGDADSDKIKAGEGSDVLYGNAGDDTLDGDALTSTQSADHLYGGEGNDRLFIDNLDITQGTVDGGVGFDEVEISASSNENVSFDMHAAGVEKAWGSSSNDTLDGSGFTDEAGGYNKKTGDYEASEAQRLDLYGRDGDDVLMGGVGRDYLDGGSDDDVISGGAGRDFLNGGGGTDTFILADDNELDMLWDYKSTDNQHDIIDINAFVAADFDYTQLSSFFHVDTSYVYFDKTGQGTFTYSEAIAKMGGGVNLDDPVNVTFNDIQVSFDPDNGDVVVVNVNAPASDDGTVTGLEDSGYTFSSSDFSFADLDPYDTLSLIKIDSLPASGSITLDGVAIAAGTNVTQEDITDGKLQFIPVADENVTAYDSFTFKVGDSVAMFSVDANTMTVNITAQNDAPIVANSIDNQNVAEDTALNYQVAENTFSDIDGDSLTYTASMADGSALPDWMQFNASTRTFSGTPDNEDVGVLNLKVTASDPDGETANALFNLDITNVNDGPIQVFQESDGLVSIEAEHYHSNVARDGESWTTHADGSSSGGEHVRTPTSGMSRTGDASEGNSPELTYEINFDSPGTYHVWVRGEVLNGGDSLHVGLNGDYNHTPWGFTGFSNSNGWSNSGTTITVDSAGTQQLNLWLRESGFSVDKIVLTQDAGYTPSGSGPAESEFYNAPADQIIAEESSFSLTLPADTLVDVDAGDTLTYSATLADGSVLPSWLSFDGATRTFSGTPDDADIGTLSVKVIASDGEASNSTLFNLQVTAVNDTPTGITLDSINVSENSDGAVVGSIAAVDADAGDSHTFSVSDNRFEVVDGQLQLKSGITLDREAEDSIDVTVIATDTAGADVSQLFSLTVTDANDAPINTGAVSKTANEDNSFTLSQTELLANTTDADNDALTVSNVQVDSGSVTVTDNGDSTWTVTPDSNWSGNGQMSFDISDGEAIVTGQVNLTVTPDADAPVLTVTGTNVITDMDFNGGLASGWTTENSIETHSHDGPLGSSQSGTRVAELDAGVDGTPDAYYYSVDTSQGHDHEISLWVKQHGGYDGTDEIEIVWNGQVLQTIDPGINWGEVKITLPDTEQANTQLAVREVAGQDNGVGPLVDRITISQFGADDSVDPAYDKSISSNEDTRIALNLSATLADSDGSETSAVSLSGVPSGFGISDGTNSVTTDGGDVNVSSWDLANLTFTPVANHETDFTLTVSATSTETSGGDTAITTQTIRVDMQPVQDAAVISGDDVGEVLEDASATLMTSGSLSASDVDAGDSSFTAETVSGSYGSVTIDSSGNWAYSADNSQSAIQQLGSSQTLNLNPSWDDYVRIESDLVTSDDFTVSLWVKPETIDGSFQGFFGSEPGGVSSRSPSMWISSEGGLHWSSMGTDSGSHSGVADNVFTQSEWTHVTWVKEGTDYRFYADGNLIHTDTAPANVQLTGFTQLGRINNSFNGQLDDLQTYSRALTPAEIADTMTGDTQPDLLAHYDFSGSTLASALTDKAGNNPAGVAQGSMSDSDLMERHDTITDTVTVRSEDGTTHDITITLNGNNDAPVVSAGEGVNLIVNSSFEVADGSSDAAPAITGTSSAITLNGWDVIGTVDLSESTVFGNTAAEDWATDGQFIDLLGNYSSQIASLSAGTALEGQSGHVESGLEQTVTTESGKHYEFNFDFTGHVAGGQAAKLYINGEFVEEIVYNSATAFESNTYAHTFIGTGTDTIRLVASVTGGGSGGLLVDNFKLAESDAHTTNEDTSLILTEVELLANISDIDDTSSLSVSSIVIESGSASVTSNNDGTWALTPGANWAGSGSFSYNVSDGHSMVTARADFIVDAVADAPVVSFANVDSPQYTTDEDSAVTINLSAVLADQDGSETRQVVLNDIPAGTTISDGINTELVSGGSLDISSWTQSSLSVLPPVNSNANFDLSLVVTATEASGDSSTVSETITIQVTAVDDAPVSGNVDLGSTVEDTALVITEAQLLANASDLDGDSLNITSVSVSNGAHGSVTDNGNGTWTFTPAADYNGTDVALSFTVSDGSSGDEATATATVDVTAVDDGAVVANPVGNQSVNEDSALSFTVPTNTFTHGDGDTLTYIATQADGSDLPEWLNFDTATQTFSGTPDNEDVAVLNLKVTAADGDGETTDASFNLAINNVNDAPSPVFAESNGLISIEAEHFSSSVARSGNSWAVENDGDASGGQLVNTTDQGDGFNTGYTGTSSELTYDIQLDAPGTYYVWVRGQKADGDGDSVHIGLNGEPVTTGSRIYLDSSSLHWVNDRMDSAGRITIEVDASGTHQLNLWMREDGTAIDKIVVTNDINYSPSGSGPEESGYVGLSDQITAEEAAFSYTVDANAFKDADGDVLTYSATLANGDPLPEWVSFDTASRTFSGIPDDADLGSIQVRVTANDGSLSSSVDVSIAVTGVNDAPTVPVAVIEQIDFVWGGSSIANKSAASYDLPDDFQLGDSAWLTTSDGGYGKGVKVQLTDNLDGTLNIQVVEAKHTSLGVWDNLTAEEKTTYFESAGTQQIVATSNSETGYGVSDIAINGGTAVSGFLDTSTGKNIDAFAVVENDLSGTVIGTITATDIDGDNLTFSLTNDAGGRFSINSSTGQITVADGSQLDYESATSHPITVQVSDGLVTTTQDYTVRLKDTNEAPELIGSLESQTTAEEAVFSYTIPGNAFSDGDDGDVVSLSANLANGDPLPAWLSFDAATGTFSGVPDDGDTGSLAVVISASDGQLVTDIPWTLNVTAVNDAANTVADTDSGNASVGSNAISGASSVLANDSDVEGDSLTVTDVNGAAVNGSTTVTGDYGDLVITADGDWTYNPTTTDLDSGLIAHWTFNESSGTTVADSAASDIDTNDGTLKHGAVFVADGVDGNAVKFDGNEALINLVDSTELNEHVESKSERTINFEFKLDGDNDMSGRQILFEEGGSTNGYNLYIDSGTLYVGAWSESNGWDGTWLSTDISSIDTSEWHQISLVMDSDNNSLKAYLDGDVVGSGSASAPMATHGDESSFGSISERDNEGNIIRGSTKFHDGAVNDPADRYGFDGSIDEARIYDRALSHQEINALTYEFEAGTLQDVFTYTVSDGTDTSLSTLTIDVNRAPEALSGTLSGNDAGEIAGQLSASDLDAGDTLTFSLENAPAKGSVTINVDGTYSYNPGSDFESLSTTQTEDVTFDFRVTDSQGDTSVSAVTVTVTGTNVAPELTELPLFDSVEAAFNFSDSAGSTATDTSGAGNDISLTGSASFGTGHNDTGTAFEMNGSAGGGEISGLTTGGSMTVSTWVRFDSFEQDWSRIFDFGNGSSDSNILVGHKATTNALGFHIKDGVGGTGNAALEIDDFFTAGEWVHVTATVDDSGVMSIYKNGELAGSAQGVVPQEVIRTNNYIGKSNWDDGALDGAIDDFVVLNKALDVSEVRALYQADSVDNLLTNSLHIPEGSADTAVVGSVAANDNNGDTLTYTLTDDAGGRFAINSSTGEITVADGSLLDFNTSGSHTLSVQVSDGYLTDSSDYTVYVTNVNEAPTASDNTATIIEDGSHTLTVSDFGFNDVDNDEMTFVEITSLPDVGSLTLNGASVTTGQLISKADVDAGLLTFTPVADASGDGYAAINFKVSDGLLQSEVTNTLRFDVTPVADAVVETGTQNADTIHGRSGHDTLLGEEGADFIFGNMGNDTITGDDGLAMAVNLGSSFISQASQVTLPTATGLKGEVFDTSTVFSNLDEAIDLVANNNPQGTFTATDFNYTRSGGTLEGFLGNDGSDLSANGDMSDNTFALKMTGFIRLSAGTHDFNVASDDGFRLKIGEDTVTEFTTARGVATSTGNYTASADGLYEVELIYWQGSGGAGMDISSTSAEPFQFYDMLPAGAELVSGQSHYSLPTTDVVVDVADGVTLSAGTNNGNGTWTLEGSELNGLTMTGSGNSWDDSMTFTASKQTKRSIDVGDSSFESQALSDGAYIDTPSGSSWNFNHQWNGIKDHDSSQFDVPAADGDNAAYINNDNTSITQTLAENFDLTTSYQLQVDIGNNKLGSGLADYEVRLTAGGVTLVSDGSVSPAEGQFETLTINLDGSAFAADSPAIGQPITIELVKNSGPQITFDNVRLTATITEQVAEETVNTDQSDQITGGAGDDILTGGNDADTFIWNADDVGSINDPAVDTITDFHTGQNGDLINLADVLVDDSEPLENYLSLNFENGDTTIEVKPAGDSGVTQKIKLEGVDLNGYGGGISDSEILNNLIDDGNLQID